MKHLRKYNENLRSVAIEMREFITDCFIDFIDDGGKVEAFTFDDEWTISVMIPKPEEPSVVSSREIISRTIEKNEKENEILNNIQLAIERVNSRYKVYPKFDSYSSSYELEFSVY